VPLWLFVAWLGIAAGYPIAPTLLEIILLVSVGIVPILVMQWKRPFSPFGLLLFSLQPSQLSLAQRKMLQRLQSNRTHFLTGLGVIPMIWIIGQLYTLAPLAQRATPIPNHVVGLGVAAIALLAANLSWQVPLSVVGVLLTRPSQFDATEPYPVAAISAAFTSPGFPVQKILPVVSSASPAVAPPPAPGSTAPEPEASETDAIAIPTPDDSPDPSETPLASAETAVEASVSVDPPAAEAEPTTADEASGTDAESTTAAAIPTADESATDEMT
jgi:hypothetical protein